MREGALGKAEDPTVRSVLGTLYDLPGSVPAVAAGVTLSPAVGAAIGGVKTGAEAADRAVQNGASPEESILYGTGLALANYAVGRLPVEKDVYKRQPWYLPCSSCCCRNRFTFTVTVRSTRIRTFTAIRR